MDVSVVDLAGQSVGTLALNDAVWGGPANLRVVAQAVAMYRANQRSGTASTKNRGDVSGGGKKPWKQKHTGRARAGSTRSPIWRHGGVVFGPHPRDFGYTLPKAILRKALLESLKGKLRDEELVVVKALEADKPKTKPFAGLAKTFGVAKRSVIVLDVFNAPTLRSLRNLAKFELRRAEDLNAFDVANAHKVLVTKQALQRIEERLGGSKAKTKSNGNA